MEASCCIDYILASEIDYNDTQGNSLLLVWQEAATGISIKMYSKLEEILT